MYSTAFEFDKDGKTTKVVLPSGKGLQYTYDTLGRNLSKTLSLDNSKSFIVSYGYKEGYAGSGTTMISSIKNGNSEIKYTYDSMGRIETINNGKSIKYYYDNLGQVIREDNGELNKTIVYTYDKAGNILKVTEYDLTSNTTLGTALKTINYSYGDNNWKDKLTSFNGKNITYDAIGNPLTYDGYTFTWEGGRTLSSISGNGKNISYKYNIDGIRTEKTVNGVNYKYTLEGNNVVYEEITNGSTVDKLVYNYGDSGLVGFTLNGTEYFYIRNAQGDIIGILDFNGVEVVKYTYDTWGKLISIDGTLKDTVGVKNPYRYRRYRYDTETGLYYLQSRYYNQEWGRFINADDVAILEATKGELLGYNLYAYCTNEPINHSDDSGYWKLPNWAKVAIGVAAIGVGVAATALTGGAAAPVLVASLKVAAVSAASSAAISVASNRISTGNWSGSAKAALDGASNGFMWGGLASGATATTTAVKGIKVMEIGKIKPSNKNGKGYVGVKYQAPKAKGKYTTKSFEFHTPHNGHGYHWQMNKWNPVNNTISSKGTLRWTWYGRGMSWYD